MIASLVTAMAALAVRVGMRRPVPVKAVAKTRPIAVPAVQQPQLQCPVCGDRHTTDKRSPAG
jgi:hypothetical protein